MIHSSVMHHFRGLAVDVVIIVGICVALFLGPSPDFSASLCGASEAQIDSRPLIEAQRSMRRDHTGSQSFEGALRVVLRDLQSQIDATRSNIQRHQAAISTSDESLMLRIRSAKNLSQLVWAHRVHAAVQEAHALAQSLVGLANGATRELSVGNQP